MRARILTDHKVNHVNQVIDIIVCDEPNDSGACHAYMLLQPKGIVTHLNFQNGPIVECGINGITDEALLEVLIDRQQGFQAGPFACPDKDHALGYLQDARGVLLARTQELMD